MEITNIDELIEKQEKLNTKLYNEVVTVTNDVTVTHSGVDKMVSHTSMMCYKESIILTRFINGTMFKVVFNCDVLASSLCDYFTLEDSMFTKCSR